MNFLNTIDDNSVLILNYSTKIKVLDYINENKILKTLKIMSFSDLKKGLLFDYSNETIYRVMNEFKLDYDTAKKYIDNLYYLEDKTYTHDKYKYLVKIKEFVQENGLLIYDTLFKNLLKGKKIYVYGFDYIDSFNKYLLDKLEDVTIIPKEDKNYKHTVYEFDSMQDELTFVCENIAKLIKDGIDLNKIYIANYDDQYFFSMKRIFDSYHIPYYIRSETSLYDTAIGEYVSNNFTNNFYSVLAKVKTKFDINNNTYNNKLYIKLKALFDTYFWVKDEDVKELFIEEMKKTKLPVDHMEHEITITDILNNCFNDDEYVFLINFNQGSIPKIKKDIDYLSDDIKPSFLSKSYEYNKEIKEALIKACSNIKNLTITYKNNALSGECLPSSLIDNDIFTLEKGQTIISKYSNLNNKILFAAKLDKLLKFNELDDSTLILNSNYDIPYHTYNHEYKSIDRNTLINTIDGKINFSYTNIEKYYECPFKFYLKYILKIDEFNDTLDTLIGNAFHNTLENVLKSNCNGNDAYDEFINNISIPLSNKDKFFLKKLKEEINFIIDVIRKQYQNFNITKQEFETNRKIELNYPFNTTIKGYVDKIIYMGNTAFIIDYKTGKEQINNKLFEFGLNLQLPIYLYLLSKLESNTDVQGIYIQQLLKENKKFSLKESSKKENNLKLDGITFGPLENIKDMDSSYERSNVIIGLQIDKETNDLKYGNRIYTEEKKKELIDLVDNKINECISQVSDANFDIKPIKIDKIDGCSYCPYKDICFKLPSDYDIKEIKGDDDECLD